MVASSYSFVCGYLRSYEMPPEDRILTRNSFLKGGAWIAQSVQQLAAVWKVRGSNPGGKDFFRTHPDRPWGLHNLLYIGYWIFLGGKAAGAWL